MAWDKTNPAGTQKIRLSDEEIRDNNDALEDAIGRNHDFPGTYGGDAGEHTVVELQDQAGDAATPASVIGVYNDSNVLKARLASSGRIIRLETEIQPEEKTSAYTALLSDFGKCIFVTGTTTITLDAAATLGNGWYIYIKNNGGNTVTIDTTGAETIDGASSKTLLTQYDSMLIVCGGGGFHALPFTSAKPVLTFENSAHDHSDSANGGLIDEPVNRPYIRLVDAKATTTDGGGFTKDAWQKRTITTETDDTGNNCSVASSVITLAAGTYDCLIECCAHRVGNHQARLRNTSDGATEILGTNGRMTTSATYPAQTYSVIRGRFTIAGSKDFEIQHYCSDTQATDGFGIANGFGEDEIYLVAEFWKVA